MPLFHMFQVVTRDWNSCTCIARKSLFHVKVLIIHHLIFGVIADANYPEKIVLQRLYI